MKSHIRTIIPVLLALTIIITSASVGLFSILKTEDSKPADNTLSSVPNIVPEPEAVEKAPVSTFKSIVVTAQDFIKENATNGEIFQSIDTIVKTAKDDGFDTIELVLNFNDGLLYSSDKVDTSRVNLLEYFNTVAHKKELKLFGVIDIGELTDGQLYNDRILQETYTLLSNEALGKYTDMVIFKNCQSVFNEQMNIFTDSSSTLAENTGSVSDKVFGPTLSFEDKLGRVIKQLYLSVAKSKPTLGVGIETDCKTLTEKDTEMLKAWFNNGYVDFIKLYNPQSTQNNELSFKAYYEGVKKQLGIEAYQLHCALAYEKIGSKENGWQQTDQILRQLKELDELNVSGFSVGKYNDFIDDTTESRDAVKKFLANQFSNDYILKDLSVSSPKKSNVTTHTNTYLLMGASDPQFQLKLNGEELERNELGYFSLDLDLKDGLNTFKLEHKGVTKTYKITFDRIIIKELFPTKKQELPSHSTLSISCTAISGSTVTATLSNIKITLSEEPIVDSNGIVDPEYSSYSGLIDLPTVYDENRTMGKITFKATSKYGSETKQSENIIVLKEDRPVISTPSDTNSGGTGSGSSNAPSGGAPWEQPSSGDYINVNSNLIGEVVGWQLEMFDANAAQDYSRPTNNFLPKGTVDYASTKSIVSNSYILRNWRYGKSTYDSASSGSVKYYTGTLPDHNSVNIASFTNIGSHTILTLDTLWKAPFKFDIAPQNYPNNTSSNRDYTITSATYTYIDITFCYTTLVAGEITVPDDNPVFSKAEWIKNESDYTLRLHLKKTGKFYGWSADYNSSNQLVFTFLNPAKITAANNAYGHRLDGVKIFIDVGHGGTDSGASGSNPKYNEAVLNLILAKKLKTELESIGATVIMSREDNSSGGKEQAEDKKKMLRQYKPDYCISIHRNASGSKAQGFMSYHFNAFSSDAAKMVYNATENGTYKYLDKDGNPAERDYLYIKDKWYGTKWHVYYMGRQTDCPVVLTENGFMTNVKEYSDMIKDDFNQSCAVALAQGIVDYFKSIQ